MARSDPTLEGADTEQDLAPAASSIWLPALKEAAVLFALSALVLTAIYALFFEWFHSEFEPFMGHDAKTRVFQGKQLQPVNIGGGYLNGSDLIITDFAEDEAVVALTEPFDAEDYPFIKINMEGFTRFSRAKILWRRADDPSQVHGLELNRSGDEVTQVAMVYGDENYRGRIADLALLIYDGPALGFENNNDVDITLHSVELRPFSADRVTEQIYEDWTNPPLWQGYSNNIVRGIHANGMVFPNAVANLLVLSGVMLGLFYRLLQRLKPTPRSRNRARLLVVSLSLCLFGWVFNDLLRWHWRVEQLIDTHERYAGLPLEERIRNNPIRCARFPGDCAAHLLPYF